MRLVRLLPLLLCQTAVRAQPIPVFRVTLSPAPMPANGSGRQSLRWSIQALPGPADILLTDSDRKDRMVRTIEGLSAARPQCHGAFYLDPAPSPTSCSLRNALSSLILFAGPAPFDKPPTASSASSAAPAAPASPVTIFGVWIGKAPATVASLCIVTAIDAYQTNDCAVSDASARTEPLGDLALDRASDPAFGLGPLSPSAAGILIRVHGPASSVAELQKAAVHLYKIAAGLKLAPGSPLPSGAQARVEQAARAAYTIEDSNWPAPVATFRETASGGSYILTLRNLAIVTAAKVVLTRGSEAALQAVLQTVLQTGATEAELAEVRRLKACELDVKYQLPLASIVGTIPTTESAWKISRAIARSPELNPPVIPQPPSDAFRPCDGEPAPSAETAAHRIEFTAVRRAVTATLSGTANAGISASPHGLLSGTGQIAESHMLLKTSETWGDSGSLNIDGGAEVQTANLTFGLSRSVGTRQTVAFGVEADGVYLRDRNQRYGYLAGPKFVDEEYGANPRVYATWTRPASLYALSAAVQASLGAQFRHVLVEPPAAYPRFPNHGWVNGFDPAFSAVAGYDFTHSRPATKTGGGLGQVYFRLSANPLAARKFAGSDFNFNRYSAFGAAELFFGVTGTGDFLVRYERGVSAASSGTPLFELPQMGGPENIRSIEQSEFVGRGLGYDRSEFAVNAASAWRWIRHRPAAVTARPDPPQAASPVAGLGITGIYVGALYDRARIGPNSALSSLFDLSRGFHGSGVEGEVRGLPAGARRVNIDFIYSRSPESVLHRKGVFLTSVSLDF